MTPTQEAITKAIKTGKELCVCAAIRWHDKVWRGHRHGHVMEAMRQELGWRMTGQEMSTSGMFEEQGFVTNLNRYVSREEALKLHQDAGIPSADKTGYRPKIMFSEDLY